MDLYSKIAQSTNIRAIDGSLYRKLFSKDGTKFLNQYIKKKRRYDD